MIETRGYRQRVEKLVFSPDGQRIAFAGHRGGINLWNLDDQTLKSRSEGSNTLYEALAIAFHFELPMLFVATWNSVRMFDVMIWECHDISTQVPMQSAYIHPHGSRLFSINQSAFRCHHIADWRQEWFVNLGFGVAGVGAYRPASNEVILSGFGDRIQLHDAETGVLNRTINTTVYPMMKIRLSNDERFWVVVLASECVVLDGTTFEIITRLKATSGKFFTDCAFHPTDRLLATTSNDEMVRMWDTTTWTERTAFTWNIAAMRSVAFAPDGMRMAAGSGDGRVMVWDVDW